MLFLFPGVRLKGKDVVKAGIATHFVPSKRIYELQTLLSRCQSSGEVDSLLNKFHEACDEFSLAENIKHINYCFSAPSIEEIFERLHKVNNEWSAKTIKVRLSNLCVKQINNEFGNPNLDHSCWHYLLKKNYNREGK